MDLHAKGLEFTADGVMVAQFFKTVRIGAEGSIILHNIIARQDSFGDDLFTGKDAIRRKLDIIRHAQFGHRCDATSRRR